MRRLRFERLHELLALAVQRAVVQRPRAQVEGLQRAVVLQQERRIDDLLAGAQHRLLLLVEGEDRGERIHRGRATVDLARARHVAAHRVGEGAIAALAHDLAPGDRDVAGRERHAAIVLAAVRAISCSAARVQEVEHPIGRLLGGFHDRSGERVFPEALQRLARGILERPMHGVDAPDGVLEDVELREVQRLVAQRDHRVVDEDAAGAEGPEAHVVLVELAREVRRRRVARVEEDVVHLLQVALDRRAVAHALVLRLQLVPALRARREHRLHRRGESVEREGCRRVEELLRAPLAFEDALRGEEGAPREDALGDVLPERLPIGPLALGLRLPAQDFVDAGAGGRGGAVGHQSVFTSCGKSVSIARQISTCSPSRVMPHFTVPQVQVTM
jgi:hypothetical protein